jgi:hypothetical protein
MDSNAQLHTETDSIPGGNVPITGPHKASLPVAARNGWRKDMLKWLAGPCIVAPSGVVMSWHNPVKPGFPYPEIGGYLLSLFAAETPDLMRVRQRTGQWLAGLLTSSKGVGKDGILYLFDTAMVLRGLLAHRQTGGEVAPEILRHAYEFIRELVQARIPARDPAGRPVTENTWSLSFGCHELKVIKSLIAYGKCTGNEEFLHLVGQLLDDLCPLFDHGRFRAAPGLPDTQLHAHCYALEGILERIHHDSTGTAALQDMLGAGTDWLANVQHPDGHLPEWHNGRTGYGRIRGDITAQAIRLWCSLDRHRYASHIQRAVEFLHSMQIPGQAVRFEAAGNDANTCATIFAAQALRFVEGAGPTDTIV